MAEEIKYIPFGKRILVELPPLVKAVRRKSGIIIPEHKGNKKEIENKATVVGFGISYPNASLAIEEETGLQFGNKILFNETAGELVKQGKRRFRIIELEDIYAIIK